MSITTAIRSVYLGTYNPEKRLAEMGATLSRLLKAFSKRPDPVIEQPKLEFKEEDKDPLMTTLEKKKTDLEKLKQDAENYEENSHVNQEFRRIYATTQKLQLELDRVDLQGRDEAKALKRQCIILANRICDNVLMGKLHSEDCSNCTECLPIA